MTAAFVLFALAVGVAGFIILLLIRSILVCICYGMHLHKLAVWFLWVFKNIIAENGVQGR